MTSFTAPAFLRTGESTTFQIILNATNSGRYTGVVSLSVDEQGNNLFTFPISDTVNTQSPPPPEKSALNNKIVF